MTGTPTRQMVLRMTVDAADAKPFSTIRDADGFANCELRGFHFDTIIIGGRIVLFKRERRLLLLNRPRTGPCSDRPQPPLKASPPIRTPTP